MGHDGPDTQSVWSVAACVMGRVMWAMSTMVGPDDGRFGDRVSEPGGRKARRGTRGELLAAGVRLYSEPSLKLLRRLTAGAVAEEAGFHRQTFYRYWDTQEEYVDDLVAFVLDDDAAPVADGVDVVPDRREVAGRTFAQMVADIARYDVQRMRGDPLLDARVGLWSLRDGRPEIDERLTAAHDQVVARLTESYERLFARWDRAPKPPFTYQDIARLLDALLAGIVLRPVVADGTEADELYALAVVELLPALSQRATPTPLRAASA